ncbi:hypothetical protein ThvES_00016980 [Thiovulum sp. ES]|nr:hypothetical protein ThvES_00016980 [Thiovulum sp. ES]
MINNLNTEYLQIIDSLYNYQNYKNQLSELNSKSRNALANFKTGINNFIRNSDLVKNIDFINTVNAYIEIIFIHRMSLFWLHGEKSLNDNITESYISFLHDEIQKIYRETLSLELYMNLFISENGIDKIDKYIVYDDFNSMTDFLKWFKSESNTQQIYFHITSKNVKKINLYELEPFIDELFNTLEKINNLNNMETEIDELANFYKKNNDIDIKNIFSLKSNEPKQIE